MSYRKYRFANGIKLKIGKLMYLCIPCFSFDILYSNKDVPCAKPWRCSGSATFFLLKLPTVMYTRLVSWWMFICRIAHPYREMTLDVRCCTRLSFSDKWPVKNFMRTTVIKNMQTFRLIKNVIIVYVAQIW